MQKIRALRFWPPRTSCSTPRACTRSLTRATRCCYWSAAGGPAPWGTLPVAITRLGGLLTGSKAASDDLFRDRVEEPGQVRARLVLVRDGDEAPDVHAQADELVADCGRRGVAVSEMAAEEGAGPVGRLGSLIGLLDFTAVYVGLASGAPVLGGPDPDGEDDL